MKLFHSNDKNLKELLKGSSSAFFLKITGMCFTYLSMLFITRTYGAETWGLYTLGFTVLSIAVVVPVFGFDNALLRLISDLKVRKNSDKAIVQTLIKASFISAALSFIVIYVIQQKSGFIANTILRKKEFEPFLELVQIAVLPMALLSLISVVFQSHKQIIQFMLFKSVLLSILFFLFLSICHTFNIDAKVFEIYIYAIISTLIIALIALFFFFRAEKTTLKGSTKTPGFMEMIRFSFPMMLSSSFALLMGWTDILMLSYFGTTTDIGIYSSALKLASLTLIALTSVNAISSPKFAESFSRKNFKDLEEVVQKSTKLMFIVSAPILLVFMLLPKTILSIFGDEFISGYIVLILLCGARFINSVSGSVGHLMQMTNNQKTYQYVIVLAFVINLGLNYLLIPNFGINGAAVSSALAMIFWNITLVVIIKRRLGFWTYYFPFQKQNK